MNLAAFITVRPATERDLAWLKPLADRHKREIGFVVRGALVAAVERGELLALDGQVGFCHYHRRRDGWSTIYEIVSELSGGGRALFDAVPRPTRLRCPVDLPANGFYAHVGGQLVRVDAGRRRALNVWEWTG